MERRCEKLKSLERVAEWAADSAGDGKADQLLEKLNNVRDQMNALLNKAANRQVFHYYYYYYYRASAVAASPVLATIGMSVRPSVRLSVRPSHADIV